MIKLKFLIFLCLTMTGVSLYAQTGIDTLWIKWQDTTLTPKERVKSLHKYTWKAVLYSYPDSAYKMAQIEYQFAKDHNLVKEMAGAMSVQGVSYNVRGMLDEALDKYQDCLEIYKGIEYQRGIAVTYNNLGGIYKQKGDYVKTIEFYEKSHQIKTEIGDQKGIATSLNNIAVVYSEQGNYSKSLALFKEAKSIYNNIGNLSGVSGTLLGIGVTYKRMLELDTALVYYQKALAIQEELGDKRRKGSTLNNIGNIYKNKHMLDSALYYHQEGLKLKREINNKTGIVTGLNNLANVYRIKKEYQKALECYEEALKLSNEIGNLEDIRLISIGYYRTYAALDSMFMAREWITNAISVRKQLIQVNFPVLSEYETEKYFETMKDDFEEFYDFALHVHTDLPDITAECYDHALITKGLALKSTVAMRKAILNSGDAKLIATFDQWNSIKHQMAKAYSIGKKATELVEKANQLEKDLMQQSYEFSDIEKVRQMGWKDVQQKLGNEEAAIEFIQFKHREDYQQEDVFDTIYCALIVKRGMVQPVMVELFHETDLSSFLGSYQGSDLGYVQHVYGTSEKHNIQLYDLIWKPLAPYMKGVNKVYLSPVGLLHKVSFAAISNDEKYLSDKLNIQVYTSTSQLVRDHLYTDEKENIALFGGITYDRSSSEQIWKELPGTLEEVAAIRSLYANDDNVGFYTGDQAKEEVLKKIAGDVKILHIATHGFFYPDPVQLELEKARKTVYQDVIFRGAGGVAHESFVKNRNPLMRSGLIFAGANHVWDESFELSTDKEDGVLTAQEVANLDMRNTELVVLSACETGLGDIKGTEGVYGLQRAFKMAGAGCLIMSLWQVPDKETKEFMVTFYQNYREVKEPKKAFSLTQADFRKKYDPYYWAAFILVE